MNFARTAGQASELCAFPSFRHDGARRNRVSVQRISNNLSQKNAQKSPHAIMVLTKENWQTGCTMLVVRCALHVYAPRAPRNSTRDTRGTAQAAFPSVPRRLSLSVQNKTAHFPVIFGRCFSSRSVLALGLDVQPPRRLHLHGGPDTQADLIDPSLMLGHLPNINPLVAFSMPLSSIMTSVGATPWHTPVVVTMLDLSRRSVLSRSQDITGNISPRPATRAL